MTDSETSAIYSVLRGLDGVDEKTLKRPEVAYLPTVLEDGELPECVLDGQLPEFVVATDRRVIQVSTSILGKVKKPTSYPYHEISRVEGTLRMHTLNIHTTNRRMPIQINAPKDRVEAFIAFVNPKIAEHRDPEPEIYSVLRRLEGVEEKTLAHPAVAYLPSVLEDGELPECVLDSPSPQFVVATDRRIVHVSTSRSGDKIKKHTSYPYSAISSVNLFSVLRMNSLNIHTQGKQITITAHKDNIEAFIAFVNPKIAEHREPDNVDDLGSVPAALKMASIQAALRRLDGIEKFGNRGEIKHLPSILWEDEFPLQITSGWYNGGNSLLVATDRRVILIDKGVITLKVEDFHYANITSVESRKGFGLGEMTIFVAGNKEQITQVPNDQVLVVADFIRNKVHELKTPSPPPPALAPAPAPTSVVDELLKFSELLEKGLISQEEFDAQKAKLLGS